MHNEVKDNRNINGYITAVAEWHHNRNLVDGTDNPRQFVKLMEEVGELAGNIARGKDVKDDIGDIIVVLINICEREGVSLQECLATAWDDIKDRKGKMINGVFVKEADL